MVSAVEHPLEAPHPIGAAFVLSVSRQQFRKRSVLSGQSWSELAEKATQIVFIELLEYDRRRPVSSGFPESETSDLRCVLLPLPRPAVDLVEVDPPTDQKLAKEMRLYSGRVERVRRS